MVALESTQWDLSKNALFVTSYICWKILQILVESRWSINSFILIQKYLFGLCVCVCVCQCVWITHTHTVPQLFDLNEYSTSTNSPSSKIYPKKHHKKPMRSNNNLLSSPIELLVISILVLWDRIFVSGFSMTKFASMITFVKLKLFDLHILDR